MKKKLIKLVSAGLTLVLTISGSTVAFGADSMSSILPAAGTARVLNEGVSVTAVQADKIKSSRGIETKTVKAAVKAIADVDDLPCVVCCPAMDFDQKESLAREGIAYIPGQRDRGHPGECAGFRMRASR